MGEEIVLEKERGKQHSFSLHLTWRNEVKKSIVFDAEKMNK